MKLYIFLASVLLVIYLLAQLNKPKPTDWEPTLVNTDKIPFGTYVLYHRINDIFPGAEVKTFREPVYNVINDEKIESGTYIIICDNIGLNQFDYKLLKKFIEKGNDVFIAAGSFRGELSDKLDIATMDHYNGGAVRTGFYNNQFKDNLYGIDKHCSDTYFSQFDTAKAVVIGKNAFGECNYLRFAMGKGSLYLNANPKMFSNYSLFQEMGEKYSSIALSYLKNTKNLYWDTYYTQGAEGGESPMRVFLDNTNLRRAFYIAIFSLLIFVLYEMKRRQRIIPIIPPLSNTSVEFAGIVGQVYYEQRNNGNIAQKMVAYFLEHIRTRYHIRTQLFDEEFITTLAQKSGAEQELVKTLSQQIIYVNNTSKISDSQLIDLNHNIEQFYTQSS